MLFMVIRCGLHAGILHTKGRSAAVRRIYPALSDTGKPVACFSFQASSAESFCMAAIL
jgi:hypothetical protein